MKEKAIMTLILPIYSMEDAQRLLTAGKVLELTSDEMLRKALDEFLKKRFL